MTCRNGFLIDDGTDVESFRHTDVVEVFNKGNRLSHSQTLGCETSQDICLGILSKSHKSLGIFYSFLHEQSQITSISMYHHAVGITEQGVEFLTSLFILFDDFHIHIVRHCERYPHCCLSSSHDDTVLHVGVVFLTHNLAYIRNILLGGHEVGKVTIMQFVITTGDDGFSSTFQCHNMIGVIGTAE